MTKDEIEALRTQASDLAEGLQADIRLATTRVAHMLATQRAMEAARLVQAIDILCD